MSDMHTVHITPGLASFLLGVLGAEIERQQQITSDMLGDPDNLLDSYRGRLQELHKAIELAGTINPKPVVLGKFGYTSPKKDSRFVAYCPEVDIEFFATLPEAEARAHDMVQAWLDEYEGWGEDADKVFVAQIIQRSTQVDRIDRPAPEDLDEEGCDGQGEYWDADWEYKCNYKLLPVSAEPKA